MGVADELAKLAELHRTGALNDREYADAKEAVLRRASERVGSAGALSSGTGTLGDAANRYVTFQIAMSVITTVIALLLIIFFFLPRFGF